MCIRLALLGEMMALRVGMGSEKGSKVVRLLVDTGSAYTVLRPDFLEEMGCGVDRAVRHVKVVTAGGVIRAPIVVLPWINCLGQRFENVPVMAHSVSFGTFTSGLLGIDLMRRCDAVIHTRRAEIWLGRG
ncbi:MAG: clan AA aspartic protease [Alkalinema sp. RU_4_3]|nr:clan AA aspartic protease [Alkalinema sp. RU_4_3]